MQRAKWLQQYQLFDARYLITLDASRYFSSCQVHCEHCLTSTHRTGTVRYHHDILQAAIVHPDKRQVLPLAPEFVRNSDANGGDYDKQDCEINAGSRMLERLRADYPRMGAIIVADSLYSKQPFVEQLTAKRFSFLLVAKPEGPSQPLPGRGRPASRQPAGPSRYRPPRRTPRVRVGYRICR